MSIIMEAGVMVLLWCSVMARGGSRARFSWQLEKNGGKVTFQYDNSLFPDTNHSSVQKYDALALQFF
jgi:hypothetical protein